MENGFAGHFKRVFNYLDTAGACNKATAQCHVVGKHVSHHHMCPRCSHALLLTIGKVQLLKNSVYTMPINLENAFVSVCSRFAGSNVCFYIARFSLGVSMGPLDRMPRDSMVSGHQGPFHWKNLCQTPFAHFCCFVLLRNFIGGEDLHWRRHFRAYSVLSTLLRLFSYKKWLFE